MRLAPGVLLAIVALLCCGAADRARGGGSRVLWDQFNIRVFSEDLPQKSVKTILQTSDGYIWFGTRFGLVRFDGVNFVTFDPHSDPPLADENCSCLFEDPRDRSLWICRRHRVTRFKDGRFTTYDLTPDEMNDYLLSYAMGSDGSLWLGAKNRLLRFRDGHVLRTYTIKDGLQNPSVSALCFDQDGQLWVGTQQGLHQYDQATGTFLLTEDTLCPDGWITCIYRTRDELWVGTREAVYRRKNGEWRRLLENATKPNPVLFIYKDSLERVWIGTEHEPLRCWEGDTERVLGDESGFARRVFCAMEDREGNLWMGTAYDGAARLQPRHMQSYSRRDGLPEDDVLSIAEAHDGSFWFGCNRGAAQLKDGVFTMRPVAGSAGSGRVKAVFVDRAGTVWAGTQQLGLRRFESTGWVQVPLTGKLTQDEVSSFFEDRDRRLWVGTRGGLFRREGDRFVRVQIEPGRSIPDVRAMVQDEAGDLWVGTYRDGLYRLGSDGRFSILTERDGLASNCIWVLHLDRTGALWMGTSNHGLHRWKDGAVVLFTVAHGLFDNVVNSILEDAEENLWIGTNRGIYQVPRRDLEAVAEGRRRRVDCVPFGTSDGMLDPETNGGQQPAAMRARDGSFWFPTVRGVVRVEPARVRRNELPPPVVIEDLVVNGRRMPTRGEVRLAPGSGRVMQIHFTGNSFVAPEKVRFRYCLDGCDLQWSEPGAGRIASYTNLKPGKYRFQVKAANNHGVWGAPEQFEFSIAPHFYETMPFYGACGAAVLLAGWGMHRRRMGVMTRIQRLEKERALERERSRIAREMHDDLGTTLTQIGLLTELADRDLASPEVARPHLELIKQTTRELFRSMDELVWAVNPEHDTLPSLIDYLAKRAQQHLRLAQIRFRVDAPADLPEYPLSSEMRRNLLLAVREAVNNIVRHSEATEVWMRARLADGLLTLALEDNGRGLETTQVDPARHGLVNMRQRLEAIGGRVGYARASEGGLRVDFELPLRPLVGVPMS